MDIVNYYDVLGIDETASQKEIKKAYLKMVNFYHPDKVNERGDKIKAVAHEETKKINAAKDWLLEPQKRAEYDSFLPAIKAELATRPKDANYALAKEEADKQMKLILIENMQHLETEIKGSVESLYNIQSFDIENYNKTLPQEKERLVVAGKELKIDEEYVNERFNVIWKDYEEKKQMKESEIMAKEEVKKKDREIKENERKTRVAKRNDFQPEINGCAGEYAHYYVFDDSDPEEKKAQYEELKDRMIVKYSDIFKEEIIESVLDNKIEKKIEECKKIKEKEYKLSERIKTPKAKGALVLCTIMGGSGVGTGLLVSYLLGFI